jgi:serine/threonine protein kinase
MLNIRHMQVKIGDYGIAVDVEPSNKNHCLKDKERLRCSPGYGAPEIVMLKPYGLPVDLYSLGVCLYLLLTGIQVFQVCLCCKYVHLSGGL